MIQSQLLQKYREVHQRTAIMSRIIVKIFVSKSFISILALYLACIFRPGIKLFICAPGKAQSAKIAREKIIEIWDLFPLLKKEIIGEGNFGGDYVKLTFRNGSIFDVVSALNSQRGGRRAMGLIDEVRDHNPDDINDIVLPLLNVSRKTKMGDLNPYEPHQVQLWMSSASDKNTYCYDKTISFKKSFGRRPCITGIL